MQKLIWIFIAFLIACLQACIKPPEYSNIPYLEFTSINLTAFSEANNDSMKLVLYFEDGDGDIGGAEEDSLNMYLEDSRVPDYFLKFKIPFVTLQGNHDDISGNINLTYQVSCINPVAVDSVSFRFYIIDRAGNQSNFVSTPNLNVVCD